jgi:hypothetical protein
MSGKWGSGYRNILRPLGSGHFAALTGENGRWPNKAI